MIIILFFLENYMLFTKTTYTCCINKKNMIGYKAKKRRRKKYGMDCISGNCNYRTNYYHDV